MSSWSSGVVSGSSSEKSGVGTGDSVDSGVVVVVVGRRGRGWRRVWSIVRVW